MGAALAAGQGWGQEFSAGAALDRAIEEAVGQGRLPGAVLVVGHDGKVVYRKAYGKRALVPAAEDMTVDTIFDVASLTKVVATTTSLMKLFEQGRFRLNDRVTAYIPEFQGGKSDITLRNLFTHFSGLRPDVPLAKPWSGYDTGIQLACTDPPAGPPGVRFVYSDINFILLGELVHRLSGQTLADYARDNVFRPLGMKETMFQPPASLRARIAPTERWPVKDGPPLRGVVHDPTARNMGGMAGHAGVFSTADDLARFAQMMLNQGTLDGVRIVEPAHGARNSPSRRVRRISPSCAGWGGISIRRIRAIAASCFRSARSGTRGLRARRSGSTHRRKTYVILLANSVHPTPRPAITPLRAKVATIVAAAVGSHAGVILTGYDETWPVRCRVYGARWSTRARPRPGWTRWWREHFAALAAKRVGLITNQTGVDRAGGAIST